MVIKLVDKTPPNYKIAGVSCVTFYNNNNHHHNLLHHKIIHRHSAGQV